MAKKSKINKLTDCYPSPIKSAEEKRWRAEDDLRALERAKEIQADKSRLSAAQKMAKEKIENLKKVC